MKALQAITKDLFEVLQHVEGAMSPALDAELKKEFEALDRWQRYEDDTGDQEDDDDDDD